MRAIVITGKVETFETRFDAATVKDSEALHNLLCYVNPGDDYTVAFYNVPETNRELIVATHETRMWILANVFGTMRSTSRAAYKRNRCPFPHQSA